jgi:hypothetical protein
VDQYRYRNAYPTGSCSLSVRAERLGHGKWSAWGERLPSDTRELERGWLVEESRAAASATSSKRVKRTKTTAPARNSAPKG